MFTTDQNPEPTIKKIAALQLMLYAICEAVEIDQDDTRMKLRTKDGEVLGDYTVSEVLRGAEEAISYLKEMSN